MLTMSRTEMCSPSTCPGCPMPNKIGPTTAQSVRDCTRLELMLASDRDGMTSRLAVLEDNPSEVRVRARS